MFLFQLNFYFQFSRAIIVTGSPICLRSNSFGFLALVVVIWTETSFTHSLPISLAMSVCDFRVQFEESISSFCESKGSICKIYLFILRIKGSN